MGTVFQAEGTAGAKALRWGDGFVKEQGGQGLGDMQDLADLAHHSGPEQRNGWPAM